MGEAVTRPLSATVSDKAVLEVVWEQSGSTLRANRSLAKKRLLDFRERPKQQVADLGVTRGKP